MPQVVVDAFVAAEDGNFYEHFGVDPISIAGAAAENLTRLRDNRRPIGASTITQQVAKNFLLTNELSLERKIKEAILAMRIERAFTKPEILELYLNEIFLGRGSYGVGAAALNYFDKSLAELTLPEAAFLAGLPQAPSRYDPEGNNAEARGRRDYVIDRMRAEGYIDAAAADAARATPLVLRRRAPTTFVTADYFAEEARRRLIARFGEDVLYQGGLSVRTTVDPDLQALADRALRHGLSSFDRTKGWRGPLGRIDLDKAGREWAEVLGGLELGFDPGDWRRAVVLEVGAERARLGFTDGSQAPMGARDAAWAGRPDQILAPGDVVVVERLETEDNALRYALRQEPEVSGGVVVLDPHTGRVLAMSGGFSFQRSSFNRATQARRQPGSAFKPFVYVAALEAGYTPSTIVLDAPIVIDQGPGLPPWAPENYSEQFYGPTPLRVGLEKSRNVMTVRLAQAIGMDRVNDVAQRFGIASGLGTNLAAALGSNEVTLLDLTAAYAELVNGGKQVQPTLFDRLQDRTGETIAWSDAPTCADCRAETYAGGPPPEIPDDRPEIVDPRIAFQTVNMLTGVVERGTGHAASSIPIPLGGKTGTTNESRDAWFIGFTPDLVVGTYVGYDQPRPLGKRATGASVALPIFTEIMSAVAEKVTPVPFRVPPGVSLVRVDPATGGLAGAESGAVILEAYLPGTEPRRGGRDRAVIGAGTAGLAAGSAGAERPAVSSGGLY
jgi:penicillin-binding protein 1A